MNMLPNRNFTSLNMGFLFAACLASSAARAQGHSKPDEPFMVVSHRGASGLLPEHTLQAYRKALDLGSTWLEPDLVMSKDGDLWIRHEMNLSDTTNANDLFPAHIQKRSIDGVESTGVFADALTSKELSTLKARQRVKSRDQTYNDQYALVRFEEFLDFVAQESKERGKIIGILPELKHPSEHSRAGLDIVAAFVSSLKSRPSLLAQGKIFVQSFEVEPLIEVKSKLPTVLTLQLIEDPWRRIPGGVPKKNYRGWLGYLLTPAHSRYFELVLKKGLKALKRDRVDFVGPPKKLMALKRVRKWFESTGTRWIPYTFKLEDEALSEQTMEALKQEVQKYKDWGASGVFTDESELCGSAF